MCKKYTTEYGRFGAYFHNNDTGEDLDLATVEGLLNQIAELKAELYTYKTIVELELSEVINDASPKEVIEYANKLENQNEKI